MIRSHALLLGAALLGLPGAGLAAEAGNEARLREALRATTAQLRAAEDDRARLQATVAEQKQQLEALQAKVAAGGGPARSTHADRELATVSRQLGEQVAARTQLEKDLAACQAGARDSATAASGREEERAKLAERVGGLNDRVSACEARNGKLYGVARELLERLQKMGLGASVGAREPFLGLKRVELQNLAQGYEDQLLDQRVPPPAAASTGP